MLQTTGPLQKVAIFIIDTLPPREEDPHYGYPHLTNRCRLSIKVYSPTFELLVSCVECSICCSTSAFRQTMHSIATKSWKFFAAVNRCLRRHPEYSLLFRIRGWKSPIQRNDKTSNWRMGTFSGSGSEQDDPLYLSFLPGSQNASGRTYEWEYSGMAEVRKDPDSREMDSERLRRRDTSLKETVYENSAYSSAPSTLSFQGWPGRGWRDWRFPEPLSIFSRITYQFQFHRTLRSGTRNPVAPPLDLIQQIIMAFLMFSQIPWGIFVVPPSWYLHLTLLRRHGPELYAHW